jgi:hypothetical protein
VGSFVLLLQLMIVVMEKEERMMEVVGSGRKMCRERRAR